MQEQKNKTYKNLFARIILSAVLIFSFSITFIPTAHADLLSCVLQGENVGKCLEESQKSGSTSFTQFTGGLEAPSTEGYAPGLTQQTTARGFILQVTNFALGFLGLIAVVIIIYGGFMYVTAAGDGDKSEKGKKSIQYAVVGIVIILSSFAIVNTVIQAPQGDDALVDGRGSAEGQGGTGSTAVQTRYNAIANRVSGMIIDLKTSFDFYYDAKKDLRQARSIIVNSIETELVNCKNGNGCGEGQTRTYSSALNEKSQLFQSAIDKAIGLLNGVKTKHSTTPYKSNTFEDSLDDEIQVLGEMKSWVINATGSAQLTIVVIAPDTTGLGSSSSWTGLPGGQRNITTTITSENLKLIFAQFDSGYSTYFNATGNKSYIATHDNTESKLKTVFESTIVDVVFRLLVIREQISPVAQAQDSISQIVLPKLAELSSIAGGNFTGVVTNAGDLYSQVTQAGHTGVLKNLLNAVTTLNLDVTSPEQGQSPTTEFNIAAIKLAELYKLLTEIIFVDTRISASTTSGNAPLVVNFSSVGSTDPTGVTITDSQITWDLDGNGKYGKDEEDPWEGCKQSGTTTSCIYKDPGTYRARLKIESSNPSQVAPGIAELIIRVNPPVNKINISYSKDGSNFRDIIRYNDAGYAGINRSSITVPLSKASTTGIDFMATETKVGDEALSAQAGIGGTIMWDFGDNVTFGNNKKVVEASESNLKPTIIFQGVGTYPSMVEVTNKDGISDRKFFSVVVSPLIPEIEITPPEAKVGQKIVFDAKGSYSEQGSIVTYEWSSEPRVDFKENENSESFVMAFDETGDYAITLTVSDQAGEIGTDTTTVNIISEPPLAQFTHEFPFKNNPAVLRLDGSLSYDPDSKDEKLTYNWTINGEEISTATNWEVTAPKPLDPKSPNAEILFTQKGDYKVGLTVTDSSGTGTPSLPFEKQINVASILDLQFDKSVYSQQLAKAEDLLSATVEMTLTSKNAVAYEMDFGDGEIEEGEFPQTDSVTLSHNYTQAGKYTAKATVFDEEDEANSINAKVFIGDGTTPIAVVGATINGEGVFDTTQKILASRSDLFAFDGGQSINLDGTGRKLTYSWDILSGSTGTGTSIQKSTQKTFSKRFDETGEYTVRLKVINEENKISDEDIITIKIEGQKPVLRGLTAVPTTSNITTPVTVNVTAEGAEDPDGKIVRYKFWYFDPEIPEEQFGIQVTQSGTATLTIGTHGIKEGAEKTYQFAVEMTDNENNIQSSLDLLSYQAANAPQFAVIGGKNDDPIAKFNVDRTSIMLDETVQFVSASSDPDGTIKEHIWDWEGDGFGDNQNEGPSVSHKFVTPAPGGIQIKLKVVDDKGGVAYSTPVTIYVESSVQPPVAAFKSEQSTGAQVKFTDNSTADTANNAKITKRVWDFNVNEDSNGDGKPDNDTDSTETNPTHNFIEFGIFRTRLTVTDDQGNSAFVTNFVNVKKPASATVPLDALLTTVPARNIKDNKVHLSGTTGNVTFDFSNSKGDITLYTIDKNTNFDTDGNGIKADDPDYEAEKPGKWTTNFEKSWGPVRVKLTVQDSTGKKDTVEIDIVFDTPTASMDSSLASLMGPNAKDLLIIIMSISGLALLFILNNRLRNNKHNE